MKQVLGTIHTLRTSRQDLFWPMWILDQATADRTVGCRGADGIARNEAKPDVVMEHLQNVSTSEERAAFSKCHFSKVDLVKPAKRICKSC